MVTVLLMPVIHPFRPRQNDTVVRSHYAISAQHDFVVGTGAGIRVPTTSRFVRSMFRIRPMPNVTVVAGENDDASRISRQSQQGSQRADSIDGPVVNNLLSVIEAIINGVNDNAYNTLLGGKYAVGERLRNGPAIALRNVLFVE